MKYPKVAYRFKKILADNNLTAQQLADKSNVGKASISHYVNGTHCPSNETAGRIAKVVNVNPVWLMGFDVVMNPNVNIDITEPRYRLNVTALMNAMLKTNKDAAAISEYTGIPLKKFNDILSGSHNEISMEQLRKLCEILDSRESLLLNLESTYSDTQLLKEIVSELNTIKSTLSPKTNEDLNLSQEELAVLNLYRSADDLTKAMVRRTLGIE